MEAGDEMRFFLLVARFAVAELLFHSHRAFQVKQGVLFKEVGEPLITVATEDDFRLAACVVLKAGEKQGTILSVYCQAQGSDHAPNPHEDA
jgi:hypothetical protein